MNERSPKIDADATTHFTFPLCGINTKLHVNELHGRRLDSIVAATGLYRITAENFAKMFLAAVVDIQGPSVGLSRSTRVSLDDMKKCFASAVGKASIDNHAKENGDSGSSEDEDDVADMRAELKSRTSRDKEFWLSSASKREGLWEVDAMLDALFKSMDRKSAREISAIEACSGLCIFCMGAKSHKLAAGFDLCSGGTGALTRHGLWAFLRSFLYVILNLQAQPELTLHEIDTTCAEAVRVIFASISGRGENAKNNGVDTFVPSITFDEFAGWYNRSGFDCLHWLELLDGLKWPHPAVTPSSSTASASSSPFRRRHLSDEAEKNEAEEAMAVAVLRGLSEGEEEEEEEEEDVTSETAFELELLPDYYDPSYKDHADDASFRRLRVLPSDIATLKRLLHNLRRELCTPRMLDRLLRSAEDGSSEIVSSNSACEVFAGEILRIDEESTGIEELSTMLAQVLHTFSIDSTGDDGQGDLEGSGEYEIAELALSFGVFGRGSKSKKLMLAFNYLSDSKSGGDNPRLPMSSLATLLLSQLKMVFALGQSTRRWEREARGFLEHVVATIISAVAVSADIPLTDPGATISFDQFSEWYNNGGSELATWIELIDVDKWLSMVLPLTDVHEKSGQEMRANRTAQSEDVLSLFTFSVRRYEELNAILRLSRIGLLMPDDVHEVFGTLASEEYTRWIHKDEFDACLRVVVPAEHLNEHECNVLSLTFSELFYAFDTDKCERVDRACIASALSVLTGGRKSRKLELAFDALDSDDDGHLTRDQLKLFFTSFLTVLAMFSGTQESENIVRATIEAASRDLVDMIFAAVIESRDDDNNDDVAMISFEEFGKFYTHGGFHHASWLELLDMSKWKLAVEASVVSASTDEDDDEENGASSSAEDKDEDDDDDDDDDDGDVLFSFKIGATEEVLTFTEGDRKNFRAVLELSNFHFLTADEIHDIFRSNTSLCAKHDFDANMMRVSVPDAFERLDADDRERLSRVFSEIYGLILRRAPRRAASRVSPTHLALAFSVFAGGKKSRKLEAAWELMSEDRGGLLREHQLATYFWCFLSVLVSFSSGRLVERRNEEEIDRFVERCSATLAAEVFSEIETPGGPERGDEIDFQDFASWYTNGGFAHGASWLELLDFRKWDRNNRNIKSEE